MTEFLAYIREVNELSVIIRLAVAVICGGIIGLEREHKHRPAGFRTHILIALGSAMATLISQYLIQEVNAIFGPDAILGTTVNCDPARLGAQVIAGMGFIGAGTIMKNKRNQVKGLTTAAGLWTTAIIGMSAGVGFIEITLISTVLLFVTEIIFTKLDWKTGAKVRSTNLFIAYETHEALDAIIEKLRELEITVSHMEISNTSAEHNNMPCAILGLYIHNNKTTILLVRTLISEIKGVTMVEEL